jgi:hypothetical protein
MSLGRAILNSVDTVCHDRIEDVPDDRHPSPRAGRNVGATRLAYRADTSG